MGGVCEVCRCWGGIVRYAIAGVRYAIAGVPREAGPGKKISRHFFMSLLYPFPYIHDSLSEREKNHALGATL